MFTYHYNAQDRLVQVDDVNGSTIAEYVYDPFGRRLWKDVGGTKTYFFYADEGLVGEYDASGAEIRTYGYRPNSTWTTNPLWLKQGGEYYFYRNDHLGTPQKLTAMNGAVVWLTLYSSFGKADVQIATITNNLRFPGQYYDDLYRLSSVALTPTAVTLPAFGNESYSYDTLGNRKTQQDIGGEWSYNPNNELLSYADVTYSYDNNGNLRQRRIASLSGTNKAAVNYIYDAANRLVKVEDDLTERIWAEYGYDPFGRRLWKKVDDNITYFFYTDGGLLLGEFDSDGNPIRTYGYLGGRPLYLKDGETFYWYLTDRLGVPQKLIESNGTVVWETEYDSYGNCYVVIEEVENPLRLPGQYEDKETGLYYNFHRYYDPATGRYLQTDPAGDGLNPYAYVGGNPVNAIDPEGLCALRMVGGSADIWAGGALIGAALSGPPGWLAVGGVVVGSLTVLNGANNLIAGGHSAITGEYKQAGVEWALHKATGNQLAGDLLYTGTQLGLGYAGLRVERAVRTVKFYHGTRHSQGMFDQGIDVSLGGGQLGPGFYVSEELETAEWFAGVWRGRIPGPTDQPALLTFDIPKEALKRLRIIELSGDSLEYRRLSKAWRWGDAVPNDLRYLIDDYDAIKAPVGFGGQRGTQLKFNPRAQKFVNSLRRTFKTLY